MSLDKMHQAYCLHCHDKVFDVFPQAGSEKIVLR